MPRQEHYEVVADQLSALIDHKAFTTMPRRDITNLLREASSEPRTRIKSLVARDMSEVLQERGLAFFPSLEETATRDNLRLFRVDSVFGHLVDLIVTPSPEADVELGGIIKKVKGTWNWHLGKHRDPEQHELQTAV
jgi:hypothetical protein